MANVIASDRPRLSEPSKMKGTAYTWSTLAVTHCPGSRGDDGELVDACATCYADKGFYHMTSVRAPRIHNAENWKDANWEAYMVEAIRKTKRSEFRWFDSGDCYSIKLARKMLNVMRAMPDINFWFPTRMHKFTKFAALFEEMNALPNVVVRFSSDSINGETIPGECTSTIVSDAEQITDDMFVCPSTVEGETPNCKAHGCKACWDAEVPVIAYWHH